MAATIKNISGYILLLPIFVNSFLLEKANTSLPLDIHWFYPLMFVFIILSFCSYKSLKIPKYYKTIILILLVGVFIGFFNSIYNSLKQLLLIVLNLTYYFYVIKYIGLEKSIKTYINLAFFICFIGIIQVLLCFSNYCYLWENFFYFLTFHNIGTRLTSIESEPSYLAFSLIPAFTFVILKNRFLTFRGLIISIGYLLLNSFVAYVGLLLVILYKYSLNNKGTNKLFKIISVLISLSAFVVIAVNSSFIMIRLNDLILVLEATEWKFRGINQSTYSIITNLFVVYESVKNSLIGSGLGNHVLNYLEYIPNNLTDDVNKEEGASLGLRFISEFGILFSGYFALRLFKEFKFSSKKISKFGDNYVLFFGYLFWFTLALRIIRQGHYTMNGFMFFLTIYLLSHYDSKVSDRS